MGAQQPQSLARALAAAVKDGWESWRKESAPGSDSEVAYGSFVERIELHAMTRPGEPWTIVVEVIDRRPGRSSLASFAAETRATQAQLYRNQHSP